MAPSLVFKTFPALLLTALLVSASTGAQAQAIHVGEFASMDISPDGRTLVTVSNGTVRGGTRSNSSFTVWDIGCVFARADTHACTSEQALGALRSTFGYWLPQSAKFVIDSVTRVEVDQNAPYRLVKTDRAPVAIRPKVVLNEALDFPPLSETQVSEGAVEYLSPKGRVLLIVSDSKRGRKLRWNGGVEALPRHLYDFGSIGPERYQITVTGEQDFFFWSQDLGEKGRLLRYSAAGRRSIPLPRALLGGISIVFPTGGPAPVAAFNADGLEALPDNEAAVAPVKNYVATVRQGHPNLELRKVLAASHGDVWALLFSAADGSRALHFMRLSDGAHREVPLPPSSWDGPSPKGQLLESKPVDIPFAGGGLPARLYSPLALGKSGKLLISFHGGPTLSNISNSHEWTRYFAALGFDVLDVDYRGSSGYGAPHLLALKRPAERVMSQDLGAAIAWAREHGYPQVGFLGTSAGGLAGAAALSQRRRSLEFIVLESPLIDSPAGSIAGCRRVRGQIVDRLFGLRATHNDECVARRTGILKQAHYNATPVFLLQGGRDTRTPAKVAEAWIKRAHARGADIRMMLAEKGGHTLITWPRQDWEKARAELASWVSAKIAVPANSPAAPKVVK